MRSELGLKVFGILVVWVLIGGCISQPEESTDRSEKPEKIIPENNEELRKEISTKDIFLPSESTGTSGRLAVRLQIPRKENIRFSEGAPIIIIGEGGYTSDGIINKKMPRLDDVIVVTFIYPGGENMEQGLHSDGVYDYRGVKSCEALRDVILYCAGKIKDSNNQTIDDVVDFDVLHNNIGFIGFSFGGNIGIAVAALHKEVAPFLKYVIQWETPVSSQIATRDLGRMLLQPIEKSVSGRGDYFNPRYISYGPTMINVDYSDIQYNPESLYPVFLDGNKDGVYTTIMSSYYNNPTPDLNDNNILEIDEDWGLDAYPHDTYVSNGKIVYSRPVTYALERYKVFRNGWPERIATVKEADAYWDIRESVHLYEKALKNIPGLEGIFLLSADDHVQSDPYKSHAHQAFDGWTSYGTWFQINVDPQYIIEVDPSLPKNIIPYTEPNTPPTWEDIKSYCIPEKIQDEVYQIAAVHQMADRVQNRGSSSLLYPFFCSISQNQWMNFLLIFPLIQLGLLSFSRER